MPIAISSPAAPISRLTLLGTGAGTITGSGAAQSMGSFTTPGDIGNTRIIIEIEIEKTLGNTAFYAYLSNDGATAMTSFSISSTALVNAPSGGAYILCKGLVTATQALVYTIETPNAVAGSIGAFRQKADFDLSAAEQIYIISNAIAVGQNTQYRWRAYIEG